MDTLVVLITTAGFAYLAMGFALRRGIIGPTAPAWRNSLFCAAWVGAIEVVLALTFFGVPSRPLDAVIIVMVGLVGALSGAIAGLLWSLSWHFGRRSGD